MKAAFLVECDWDEPAAWPSDDQLARLKKAIESLGVYESVEVERINRGSRLLLMETGNESHKPAITIGMLTPSKVLKDISNDLSLSCRVAVHQEDFVQGLIDTGRISEDEWQDAKSSLFPALWLEKMVDKLLPPPAPALVAVAAAVAFQRDAVGRSEESALSRAGEVLVRVVKRDGVDLIDNIPGHIPCTNPARVNLEIKDGYVIRATRG